MSHSLDFEGQFQRVLQDWIRNLLVYQVKSGGPQRLSTGPTSEPEPVPWRQIAELLISQVVLKELASTLPPDEASQLKGSIEKSIAAEVDDICPPWRRPGPPPWWIPFIAGEVGVIANTFQDANLRNASLQLATDILRKGLTPSVEEGG
jgi:hypothetical protein